MRLSRYMAAAGMAAALLAAPATAQERISIGTGGTGGLFYVIGAGISELLNKHMPGTTARAEVTGASVENIRRVAADQMTFGFSSSSTLYEASVGEGPFEEALPVAGMAYLYPAVLQIATLRSSGIEKLEDLAGKRVNLGPPGSNSAVLAQRLLEAYGVFDAGNAQFLSYTEGTAALTNGTIDAAVVLAGAPTAALIDLGAQEDMLLLSADPAKVESMISQYPFYQVYEIPAGTYTGQTEPVVAVNDPATLFTVKQAEPDSIYKITQAIFDHLDELGQVHPQAKAISLDTAPKTPIALHPGAQRYFDEKK
ncbi:C4-dicarboxylate ABC transporter substrate-binding protein [Pseudorhizobium pelagicum]|uniref:C4-dicarboxylate ABC transporter substrate-binding protein n=2 Tax=Pseudorhizobium pelagicum TaxID=1509405 RepID=A0A922NXQ0_9HYPH|nr:C4-dicarboxylate ABC transporter substrate-binding protein [Pseudorhizobium pelagicum]KEQ06698.1 C4-dicarboxylate ABC transporter substrate-binding protein [Pseudorhizobium pelagicum]